MADGSGDDTSEDKGKGKPDKDNVIPITGGSGKLTAKQERFAQLVAFGGGDGKGMSQSEAYRRAYNAENMSAPAIWTESSVLFRHPVVSMRIAQLKRKQERGAVASAASLRSHIQRELYRLSTDGENDAAKLRSLELLGKLSDVAAFTERVEQVDNESSPEDVQEELEARLKKAFSQ